MFMKCQQKSAMETQRSRNIAKPDPAKPDPLKGLGRVLEFRQADNVRTMVEFSVPQGYICLIH